MSEVQPQACTVCNKETYQRCSRCKEAFYCTRDHMVADWPRHKATCRAPGSESTPGKAKLPTVEGILFPVDGAVPRVVKIEYTTSKDDEWPYSDIWSLDLKAWGAITRPIAIKTMGFHGPPLGRTLIIKCDDLFMPKHLPVNQCLLALTNGKLPHPWAGNIMVLRSKEPADYMVQYHDAVLEEDVPAAVAYFMDYGRVNPRRSW